MGRHGYLDHLNFCTLKKDISLTEYTTMKLRASGNILTVQSEAALIEALSLIRRNGDHYFVIGRGSNLLLPETTDRIYIQLDFPFDKDYLSEMRDEYVLPASVSLHTLSAHATRFGVKGWEVFTGIPASLGGAVYMNAGTGLGEIGDLVQSVRIIDMEGRIKNIETDRSSFSYRKNHILKLGEMITAVTLTHFGHDKEVAKTIREYLVYRSKSQPLDAYTSGCIFKNPILSDKKYGSVGKLIDLAGLKGLQYKNIKISEKHANFMVNMGGAGLTELREFIAIVKNKIMLQYGIELDMEVETLEDISLDSHNDNFHYGHGTAS